MSISTDAGAERFAYQRLAEALAGQIRRGTLRPGDRLPSVRGMSRKHRVSISTVMQAYRRLESLRLVEARQRSGFFVAARRLDRVPPPAMSAPASKPATVGTCALIAEIVRAVADPSAVPLGAALPDPALLPVRALNRSMGSALRAAGATATSQLRAEGLDELRHEIAKREWNVGRASYHDEIVVTCGASEALELALHATTRPGDIVAVESPAFFGVLQLIELLDRRVLEIPTCPERGLDVDALVSAVESHPVRACVVTPNHQNPLGARMPDASKARLVEAMAERGIPVIEDDTFGELYFDGVQPRSLRAWDRTGTVLRCGSFGKTLAPGFRVGWIVPGPRYMEAVRRVKLATTIATSGPAQLAIARYLAGGGYDRHLRGLRARLRDNVQRMAAGIAASFPEGTRISRPTGGFVLWVELPGNADSLELYGRARDAGITICPGPIFSSHGAFRSNIRVSAGHPWSEKTEWAIATLARLARQAWPPGE
ncbi:MAG TPA: PLP-dependent aminotransferase family protein [Longimicrobiales bacterium]|nr:PLP-dependent aminotransferase family protein [Longimicrobiales bacterium]